MSYMKIERVYSKRLKRFVLKNYEVLAASPFFLLCFLLDAFSAFTPGVKVSLTVWECLLIYLEGLFEELSPAATLAAA